jgi:amidophosphoribosyltransferase
MESLIAVRDPLGIRPAVWGRRDKSIVVASESVALDALDAKLEGDVPPGELMVFCPDGTIEQHRIHPGKPTPCIFEYIYFARPDSLLEGRSVHQVRRRLGARLAQERPVEADMVIGVPDSATAHAIGYANESGIPFGEGLIKNRYIGRTFIQPDDRLRRLGVALKFNPLPDLRGKRIVMVDDSIVRGTTSGPIVALVRQAGAAEVHMRVGSPPIRHPCFMGVDFATEDELIAAQMSVDEIAHHIGVDSLDYLSLGGLLEAVGPGAGGHCQACFTGEYPVPAAADTGKKMFEPA